MPVKNIPSAGSWFHSLHATSQALHPMHTVVSVKNPIACAIRPTPFERGLCPRNPPGGRFRKGGEAPLRVSSPAPWLGLLHVADERLALVDRHVGIADERGQLVDDVTGDDALVAPVPRHADLVDGL